MAKMSMREARETRLVAKIAGCHWNGKWYNDGMNVTVESVVSEALELPPPLRAFVAEKLIESLDAPDTPPLSVQWREEIRSRCAEMDRGAVELHDAGKVFARAFAALA